MEFKKIPLSFFARDTQVVAQELIGMKLVRFYDEQLLVATIVETEAYTADDPACHAYRGKTNRNQSLFGPVGRAYVYLSYGLHYCLNVVAHTPEQKAGGVLIRTVVPLHGVEHMVRNRQLPPKKNILQARLTLTNGPGKVAQALAIDKSFDGYDLINGSALYLADADQVVDTKRIQILPRVGISKAKELLRRFYLS